VESDRVDGRVSLPRVTYVGGPTALLEWGGLRLLSDPTFDPAGASFTAGAYQLRKTQGPARPAASLLPVDAVLLSHDHHFDNLDQSGRGFLGQASRVLTTGAGAERLAHGAVGLLPWQETELTAPDGRVLRVTATPARHGPAHADRGPVIGFALAFRDDPTTTVYLSGDTVWYPGVGEVAARFPVRLALLFMGAARVAAVGPWHLTFTAEEGVEAARALGTAAILPVHFEGWEHFSESRPEIDRAFAAAGLAGRLRWPVAGVPTDIEG
jgi:L-ascorbate metabolism protein UlaG (beta-lactamase superfamily)